ncbi:archease, partial [candidate division KSB1 bacterium]|nr:archease [candidate division KSB1 bacterium]
IRVYGESLEEIFASAATGMFDIIFDELPQEKQLIEEVVVTADDLEELFVNWLSELNFLFTTEDKYFTDFTFHELSENKIRVTMRGDHFDLTKHDIHTEIKAVTFHSIYVRKAEGQWQAQVIFDI